MPTIKKKISAISESTATHASIYPGLPPLSPSKKTISFFEFWPIFLIYTPPVIYWAWLTLRHMHPTLPLCSNPAFHLSGMVGERKSEIFNCAGDYSKQYIARWLKVTNLPSLSVHKVLKNLDNKKLHMPLVAKPDIGCRGAGVKLINSQEDLTNYLASFPKNADFLLQKLVPHEGEAGIFYIRKPGLEKGYIFSMAFKYQPYVVGNGKDTLKTLIKNDPRAKYLTRIYFSRHKERLNHILPEGTVLKLGFTGSHCRGAIFKDARQYITPALEKSIDSISRDIKHFHYGRFDVRFSNVNELQQGKGFTVIEINGASSEALHIWDANSTLKETLKTLCLQFKILFQIGKLNHKAGAKPARIRDLLRSWLSEKRLIKHYPMSD